VKKYFEVLPDNNDWEFLNKQTKNIIMIAKEILSYKVYALFKVASIICLSLSLFTACKDVTTQSTSSSRLFEFDNNQETRWSSPENLNGIKGMGGKANNGAKGHPFDSIGAGQSYTLLDIQDQGIINRMWITIRDRSPQMLRSLKIEMFWDNETKPAVSVPFGDFFGVGLGKTTTFQNALFANAEGRSFNCFIPMPFRKAAKIVITNEGNTRLDYIFFDVNYSLLKTWNDENLYFHAFWHRDTATQLAKDFEILPRVTGKGRFLGSNIGVSADPRYKNAWFGEGEVKMYIDGDKEFPTLVGTGTEDYIGTAWGQGKFFNNYSGCSIADDTLKEWAFYRFHIPDPVFFKENIIATIQQIGGEQLAVVSGYQQSGVPLIPISTNTDRGLMYPFYKKDSIVNLNPDTGIKGWTNFYRSDDVSATAYFFLDKPSSNLPALQPVALRTVNLRARK
jgi:hypothetical protein